MTERCVKCKRDLPPDAFSPSVLKYRLVMRCRDCVRANKQSKQKPVACERCGKVTKGERRKRYCSHECHRRAVLMGMHNLPPSADIDMYRQQGGLCAGCEKPLGTEWRSMHVDHCHETGKIRGLLHGRCNKNLADDPEKHFLLAVYLVRHSFDLRESCVGYVG